MRNTLRYSAGNNRRNTGRQTRKRETKMNMGRRYKRLDWLETRRSDKEPQKSETYMGHLHPTAVDAPLNDDADMCIQNEKVNYT